MRFSSSHLKTATVCPLDLHHCTFYHHLSLSSHLLVSPYSSVPLLQWSSCSSAFLQLEQPKLSLFICGHRSGGLSEVISCVSVEVEGLRGATAPCCVSWLSAPVLTTANKTRQRSGNLCQHGPNQLTVARSACYQRGPEKCWGEARCEWRWHS